MKKKVLTFICTLMLFIPWTILPLRLNFQWALDYADIMIPCYAGFMIFSGIFTVFSYVQAKAQNELMKVCLVINCLYAAGGVAAFALIFLPGIF